MLKHLKTLKNILWTHRAVYAALAGSYGALCLGVDKDLVNQCIAAFYAMLVLQRGH